MWIDKYKPQNLDQFFGNKENIELIEDWINNFENHEKKAVIIIGYSGSGKTLLSQLIFKKFNYNIKEINCNEIKTKKSVQDIFYKTLMHKNILEMFYYNLKNGLLVDELESILNNNDKTGLSEIINIIKNNKIENPIIFTLLKNINDKKITELKKHCLVIELNSLTNEQYYQFIDNIIISEKLKITKTVKNKFIKDCKSDLRRLVHLLEDYSYNKKPIIGAKNNDFFIDKCVYELLTEKKTLNECLTYYDYDSFLLPLYLFENFPNILNQSKLNTKNQTLIAINTIDSIIYYDIFYNTIFDSQNWDNLEIIGLYGAFFPNQYLSQCKIKNYNKPLLYASLFNKLSLKFSNKKIINNCLFSNKLIYKNDLFYIFSLFQYYLDNDDSENFINLMKHYNINYEQLVYLFKIHKYHIKNPKKKFTIKFKNNIKKLCN